MPEVAHGYPLACIKKDMRIYYTMLHVSQATQYGSARPIFTYTTARPGNTQDSLSALLLVDSNDECVCVCIMYTARKVTLKSLLLFTLN